ncbi:(d)CMP kinase [Candidatus Woesebacteria bacterium]|nr:(d)CMP kinase [Candidatus Woesebacteria bacterium]
MHTPFQIAIDGPSAAGKGTVSRLVAEKLGFLYVDTGAMYRVAGLILLESGIDPTDEDALVEKLTAAQIEMRNPTDNEKDGRLTTVLLDGRDVSWDIRKEQVSMLASKVAQFSQVRKVLVEKQQAIAATQNVVMEGRDITYRVLPHAQLKVFLTGGDVVRAKRRHLQLQSRGEPISFETVYSQVKERDTEDTTRAVDPLKKIPEAWEVDTSDLRIGQVVDLLVYKAQVLMNYEQRDS